MAALTGAAVLASGLGAVAVTAWLTAANAQTCTGSRLLASWGTTATVTITSGQFGVLLPATLAWGSNVLTGVAQTFYDTILGPLGIGAEAVEVDDLRGDLTGPTPAGT